MFDKGEKGHIHIAKKKKVKEQVTKKETTAYEANFSPFYVFILVHLKINALRRIAANEQVLLQVGYLKIVPPGTAARFCFKFEVKNFCLALFVEPKLLLIAL